MPQTKTRPGRLIATLAEIRAEPGQFMDQVVWVPTDDLLAAHHPENPRLHEEDPPGIFKSLLWMGWGEYGISFNPLTGRLTGGHGRSMAADIGRKQDAETFEKQWNRWLKEDPARQELAEVTKTRFQPSYWEHCPVVICTLSEVDQKTLLVRLNNSQKDGRDDPGKMAALLAQIPGKQAEMTGYELTQVEALKAAFLEIPRHDPAPEEAGYQFDSGMPDEGGTEYEGKERLERPDATDYSGTDRGESDATGGSGPVTPGVAQNDLDVEDTGVDVFKHSSHYSETRAILYVSKDELQEWKDLVTVFARLFELDSKGSIAKVWRTEATLETLRWAASYHPGYAQAQQDLQSEETEESQEEE